MSKLSECQLVGHRGFPQQYPENCLMGMLEAIEAGADAIELDIQLSKDGVPVIFHDATLKRTTGERGKVSDYTLVELSAFSCHEQSRLGGIFDPTPISTLEEVCRAVAKHKVKVFVEIKTEAIDCFGRDKVLAAVMDASSVIRDYRVIISFDYEILEQAKVQYSVAVGWVLTRYNEKSKAKAIALEPEILISNYRYLNESPLWAGPWQWFVYDVVDLELAEALLKRGVTYLETWDVAKLAALRE